MSSIAAKSQIKKAESFKAEAEAKLKAKTWFASSTEQKYEDAAELYSKCANAYKVGGLFVEAAEAYVLASDLHLDKLKQTSEASRAMVDAGEWNEFGLIFFWTKPGNFLIPKHE